MKTTKVGFVTLLFIWALSCTFLCEANSGENRFSGLMIYLDKQYSSPFRLTGRVNEVSGKKLLFSKTDISLEAGQELLVCDHQKGVSPPLQTQLAMIRVEAIFSESVLARVAQVFGRAIEQNDLILTPPSPSIHLYTNIESKHAFSPYQQLLKTLLASPYQIMEITGDAIAGGVTGKADLLLRLEGEGGYLVCQLSAIDGSRILFSESLPHKGKTSTNFQAGHPVKIIAAAPKSQAPTQTQQVTHPPLASPPPLPAMASFKSPKSVETSYYKLSDPYLRMIYCKFAGDSGPGLIFMGKRGLVYFHLKEDRLIEMGQYAFSGKNQLPLHLHAIDLNKDGNDELLVTLAREVNDLDKLDNRLCSEIISLRHGKFQVMARNLPYYLRVIRDRKGKRVALAQKKGEYTQFASSIYRLTWNKASKKVVTKETYKPAAGIYSIYQFNLVPKDADRVIILEMDNSISGYYTPQEKIEATGERNYGSYQETVYPVKLEKDEYIGGFDKKTYKEIYSPRRFELKPEFDWQNFLIYKERTGGVAESALKKIWKTRQGTDQVAGVKWLDQRIIESWQSKKLAKDILDFTFIENPERILILYRDGEGCAIEAFE